MTGLVEYREGSVWKRMRVALFPSVPGTVKPIGVGTSPPDRLETISYPVVQVLEDSEGSFRSGEKLMAADLGRAIFASPDASARKLARSAGWKITKWAGGGARRST